MLVIACSSSQLLVVVGFYTFPLIFLDTSCTDNGFYSRNRTATVLLKYWNHTLQFHDVIFHALQQYLLRHTIERLVGMDSKELELYSTTIMQRVKLVRPRFCVQNRGHFVVMHGQNKKVRPVHVFYYPCPYRESFAGIGFMIIIAQRLIRTIFTIQQIFISLNISIRV